MRSLAVVAGVFLFALLQNVVAGRCRLGGVVMPGPKPGSMQVNVTELSGPSPICWIVVLPCDLSSCPHDLVSFVIEGSDRQSAVGGGGGGAWPSPSATVTDLPAPGPAPAPEPTAAAMVETETAATASVPFPVGFPELSVANLLAHRKKTTTSLSPKSPQDPPASETTVCGFVCVISRLVSVVLITFAALSASLTVIVATLLIYVLLDLDRDELEDPVPAGVSGYEADDERTTASVDAEGPSPSPNAARFGRIGHSTA